MKELATNKADVCYQVAQIGVKLFVGIEQRMPEEARVCMQLLSAHMGDFQ